MLSEKALAVMRWQPVQWHAIVTTGGAVIFMRTCPQRHPASQGKFQSLIVLSLPSMRAQAKQSGLSSPSSGLPRPFRARNEEGGKPALLPRLVDKVLF
jgi:hypothetical protein